MPNGHGKKSGKIVKVSTINSIKIEGNYSNDNTYTILHHIPFFPLLKVVIVGYKKISAQGMQINKNIQWLMDVEYGNSEKYGHRIKIICIGHTGLEQ